MSVPAVGKRTYTTLLVAWYSIGRGTRRHAFVPGNYNMAYCGRGPAHMTTDGTEPPCLLCIARLRFREAGEGRG